MNAPKFLQRPTILVTALLLAASGAAFFANQKTETPPPQPRPYLIGETAKQEIVAPRKIAVVDPAQTEVRRQTEAAKIPVVFRFQKDVSDQAVAKFSMDFVFTRESFLDAVEKNFKARKLGTNQIDLPRFRKMVNVFQTGNQLYPVNMSEAKIWAQGNLEEDLLKQLCVKLRQTTERFIRPNSLSSNQISFQIRLLSGKETPSSLELLKQQSQLLRRTNFVSASKARNDFFASFGKENRFVGKFMTNYVQPNCFFEEELTRLVRAEKTNAIWAVVPFEAGQVIVHRGEVIDAKIKSALDELKIQIPVAAAKTRDAKQIWLWGAAISCASLAVIIWLLSFVLRSRTALVPAKNVLVLPRVEISDDEVHARLIPHFARGLMNKLVRALISQRSHLMRAQDAGTEQLADLEQRLDQINTRLQTRQAVYEKRIAELEKELAAAEEENRELIRAKIHEARQNLAWAKAQRK